MIVDVVVMCLALNIYFEGRSEPIQGRRAIGEVTIRRASLSGRNICQEVFLDKQFSWTDQLDRPIVTNSKAWQLSVLDAKVVLLGQTNYSNNATHYHATYIRTPSWAKQLCITARIGKHIFYRACDIRTTIQ